LLGQTSNVFKGSDDNQSSFANNPYQDATLRILAAGVNPGVDKVEYTFDVKLTYGVEIFDRKTVAPS